MGAPAALRAAVIAVAAPAMVLARLRMTVLRLMVRHSSSSSEAGVEAARYPVLGVGGEQP